MGDGLRGWGGGGGGPWHIYILENSIVSFPVHLVSFIATQFRCTTLCRDASSMLW